MRLIPPAYVKPYVRRNKSDQVDAAAIYEAMSRPWPAVRAGAFDRQPGRADSRSGARGCSPASARRRSRARHLAEIGLIAPQGAHHAYGLKRMAVDGFNENGEIVVPDCVRGALRSLVGQIDALVEAIVAIDRELAASVMADETDKRLMSIHGIGPVTASAIRATIQDASAFASGREFAAFLGLDTAPELDRRQNAAWAHHQDGRPLFAQALRWAPARRCAIAEAIATPRVYGRQNGMFERKTVKYKFNLTAVALANKVARIVFVLMTNRDRERGRGSGRRS